MAKKKWEDNCGPVDVSAYEKDMAQNPQDYFSAEETDRRMSELMRRCCGSDGTIA